jgi:hypothetical protein
MSVEELTMDNTTKSLKILPTTDTKAYGVRRNLEDKESSPIETYKPGESVMVYTKRPLQRGFRNRLYASVKTKKGKDGYILASAIYRMEG